MSVNPTDYIHVWDIGVMLLSVILRMAKSISKHQEEFKLDFELKDYFDLKHILRWVIHTISSIIALLTLPQLFVNYIQPKYFDGLLFWSLTGSATLGWLGYDLIKISERVYKIFIKKIFDTITGKKSL